VAQPSRQGGWVASATRSRAIRIRWHFDARVIATSSTDRALHRDARKFRRRKMRKAGMQESRKKLFFNRLPAWQLFSWVPAFLTSSWGTLTCIRRQEGAPKEVRLRTDDLD
jgi:hypothetical protein